MNLQKVIGSPSKTLHNFDEEFFQQNTRTLHQQIELVFQSDKTYSLQGRLSLPTDKNRLVEISHRQNKRAGYCSSPPFKGDRLVRGVGGWKEPTLVPPEKV